MPCTHHDGQEEVLEFISEAQGIGAEQGEVTLHQLGRGNEKKKKVTWGSQRPLLAPTLSRLPLSSSTDQIVPNPTPTGCALGMSIWGGGTHHEGQGGEKEACNELDIGAVTHDQPEALKEGH